MAKKTETSFEELMKNIDYTRWLQALIPVLQPIIIFGAWLGFAKMDTRADAVSKIIAFAEPIPTIDLNVPKPVVLASLYHSIDEAWDIINQVISFAQDFGDIEIPENIKEFFETEVQKPEPGETWEEFLKRRLRETGLFK